MPTPFRKPSIAFIRTLTFLVLGAISSSSTSCTRIHHDPNGGAETVYLRTLDHSSQFDVEYLRTPDEGPLVMEENAWTYFWFLPVNHPDMARWLEEELPEGAEAANLRASSKWPWYGPLIAIPTLGLVYCQRVRYEAQPVRYIPLTRPE